MNLIHQIHHCTLCASSIFCSILRRDPRDAELWNISLAEHSTTFEKRRRKLKRLLSVKSQQKSHHRNRAASLQAFLILSRLCRDA